MSTKRRSGFLGGQSRDAGRGASPQEEKHAMAGTAPASHSARYTPGPWYADEPTYTHVRAKTLEYEMKDGTIARPAVAQLLKFVPREEREANAKLIAAAPALALQLAVVGLAFHIAHGDRGEPFEACTREQCSDTANVLRAAGRL